MFSQLFNNTFNATKPRLNSNIQKRISGLFQSKEVARDCSPTLMELKKQKNKVKRLSSVYEMQDMKPDEAIVQSKSTSDLTYSMPEKCAAQISTISEEPVTDNELNDSFVIVDRFQSRSTGDLPTFVLSSHRSPTTFEHPLSDFKDENVLKLMDELVKIDAEYIEHMKTMIDVYVKGFEFNPALRRQNDEFMSVKQKSEIFGAIESIYKFHKEKFHPMIKAASKNPSQLARDILNFTRNSRFEPYLLHAMDEHEANFRREVYYKFFIYEIQVKHGIKYEFSPIDQLSRYHLIISDIMSELWKDSDDTVYELFVAAEKEMSSVLGDIKKMFSLATQLDSV